MTVRAASQGTGEGGLPAFPLVARGGKLITAVCKHAANRRAGPRNKRADLRGCLRVGIFIVSERGAGVGFDFEPVHGSAM